MADSHRPLFDNRITTGNILTILGGLLAFLFMFFDSKNEATALAGRVALTEKEIGFLHQRVGEQRSESERQWALVERRLGTIETKIDEVRKDLANKQDRTNARN